MDLLTLKNVETRYGNVKALKGISLKIEEGSIVSLIGSNGAGKTTTLKSIFGIQKIAGGEIHFNNERIDKKKPLEIAKMRIAYTMEGRRLFPRMTVQENLEMGAFFRKDRLAVKKDMEMVFRKFKILGDRSNQLAGTMSGGEQTMLTLGRALMASPKLLLMDEPSLGLAPLVVKQIGELIKEINKNGVTVFLVEQNSKLGLGVAQKGYVMEVGKIAMEGDSKELLSNEHVQRAYMGG